MYLEKKINLKSVNIHLLPAPSIPLPAKHHHCPFPPASCLEFYSINVEKHIFQVCLLWNLNSNHCIPRIASLTAPLLSTHNHQ